MAISPQAASAIIGAVPAVYQLGTGISQGIKARRLGKKKRPEYVIPNQINDNVDLARGAFNAASMYGLPGQGRIENQIMGSQAQGAEGMFQSQQSPAATLLGLSSLNQNTNNALANLGVNAANFRQNNMQQTQQGLMSANQVLAQYRDKEFEMNRLKPFQDAMNAAGALRAGSISNIYGALSSGANTLGQYAKFNALKNSPEFAGMTDDQIAQQLQSLLVK